MKLYQFCVGLAMMVFVVIVLSAGRDWYFAYVEALVPVGSGFAPLSNTTLVTGDQVRHWAYFSAGALQSQTPMRSIWHGARSTS
jgi:hypothetical protein